MTQHAQHIQHAQHTQGARRPDLTFPDTIPSNGPNPGDYWLVKNHPQWKPLWFICAPRINGIAGIPYHCVDEHEDGTISVLPNEKSSNSILVSKNQNESWHGYIRRGVWEEIPS